MTRACNIQIKDETILIKGERLMKSSFISEKQNQRVLHDEVVLSSIHIYMHISIQNYQSGGCATKKYYNGTETSQGE